MKKVITAGLAVAMLAVALPTAASADVPRCEAPVAEPATAKFTITQPAGQVGQWTNVFKYEFVVTVQPNGSFAGTDTVYNPDGSLYVNETVTGKFTDSNNDGIADLVSLTTKRLSEQLEYVDSWTLVDAKMDGTTINYAASVPVVGWDIEQKVSPPVMSAPTTTDLNHGQYVKSQGGGSEAARACAGMPLNSKQGK